MTRYEGLRQSLSRLISGSGYSVVAENKLDYEIGQYLELIGLRGGVAHWSNGKKLFRFIYNPYGCYRTDHLRQFDVKSDVFEVTCLDDIDQQVRALISAQPQGLTADRIKEIAEGFDYGLQDGDQSCPIMLTPEERRTRHETKTFYRVETYAYYGIHRLYLYIVPGEYLTDSCGDEQSQFLLTRIVHTEEDVRRLLGAHQLILSATRLVEMSCASAYPGAAL